MSALVRARVALTRVLCGTVVGVLLLAGCATPPPPDDPEAVAAYEEINDPLEPMNRAIFSFNQFVDGILFKPLALLYRTFLPPEVRNGVNNFLNNLRTPIDVANEVMQGDFEGAQTVLGRFVINSTAGVGGLIDVAAEFGLEERKEDFGQTLAVWGSGEGAYLVLPLFGPATVRDGIGLIADSAMDPLTYFLSTEILVSRTLVRAIDERERVIDTLDEIERTSIDFYATLRSLYRQRRADEIRDGEPAPVVPIPSISGDEPDEPDEPDTAQLTLVN